MNLKNFCSKILLSYAFFLIIFYIILIFEIEPIYSFSDSFVLIGDLMTFPLFWYGVKSHEGDYDEPWRYFATAAVLYFIGEAIWAYNSNIIGQDPPTPSICDAFYFSCNLMCMIGLIKYLKLILNIDFMKISFDMLITFLAVGGATYNFLILPVISEEISNDFLTTAAMIYGPIMDIATLMGLSILLFRTNNSYFFSKVNILIGSSFLLAFLLDQYNLIMEANGEETSILIAPLWSTFYMLLAVASVYPDKEFTKNNQGNEFLNTLLRYSRMLLPYVLTFSILVLIGIEYKILNPVFIWAMLLVVLISLRQIFVLISNDKLLQRIHRNEIRLNMQNIELQRLNEKIMRDAEIDFLTQLSNRRFIDQSFERLVPRDEQPQSLGVLLIDVDYFKRINDSFGHQIGDEVLQGVALIIRSAIRSNDIAGRFGGDEFIILLPGADISVTEDTAKNLVTRIHKDKSLSERHVTLSIGGTSCVVTRKSYEAEKILHQADEFLYKAKENGRDQYVVGIA